jgi:hypothetical protein
VGTGDCALSGGIGAFFGSCMKDGSVSALVFNARCLNPDVGSRSGCVWPFVYKNITFTEGQCVDVNYFDGYYGWCATEVGANDTYIDDAYQYDA